MEPSVRQNRRQAYPAIAGYLYVYPTKKIGFVLIQKIRSFLVFILIVIEYGSRFDFKPVNSVI